MGWDSRSRASIRRPLPPRRAGRAGFTLVEGALAALLFGTVALLVVTHLQRGHGRLRRIDDQAQRAQDANLCFQSLRRDLERVVLRAGATSYPIESDGAGIAFTCWSDEGGLARVSYRLVAVGQRQAVERAVAQPDASYAAPPGSCLLTRGHVLDFGVEATGLATGTLTFHVEMTLGMLPSRRRPGGLPFAPPATFRAYVFPEGANHDRAFRRGEPR